MRAGDIEGSGDGIGDVLVDNYKVHLAGIAVEYRGINGAVNCVGHCRINFGISECGFVVVVVCVHFDCGINIVAVAPVSRKVNSVFAEDTEDIRRGNAA